MSRNKRMTVAIPGDGTNVEITFYTEPNDDGKQDVAGAVQRDAAVHVHARYHRYLLQRAYADLVSTRLGTGHDGRTYLAAEAKLWQALCDGTWEPDAPRVGQAAEPSDLAMAIAKLSGLPARQVQEDIDTRVHVDDNGQPLLDGRGRKMRVFTARFVQQMLARPDSLPIRQEMARINAERAKTLAREGKTAGTEPQGPSLAGLFGAASQGPQPHAQAA